MEQAVREAGTDPTVSACLTTWQPAPQQPTRGQTGTSISPSPESAPLTSRSAARAACGLERAGAGLPAALRTISSTARSSTLRTRRLFLRAGDLRNALAQAADRGFALVEVGRYAEAGWLTRRGDRRDRRGRHRPHRELGWLNLGVAQASPGPLRRGTGHAERWYEGFAPGQSHCGLAAAYLRFRTPWQWPSTKESASPVASTSASPITRCGTVAARWRRSFFGRARRKRPRRWCEPGYPGPRRPDLVRRAGISRQWLVRVEALRAWGDHDSAQQEPERAPHCLGRKPRTSTIPRSAIPISGRSPLITFRLLQLGEASRRDRTGDSCKHPPLIPSPDGLASLGARPAGARSRVQGSAAWLWW